MRNRVGLTLLAILFTALARSASADDRFDRLPQKYKAWLQEDAAYIISDTEREAFLELVSDEERESFIDVFWRKRDETPSTPENEYKEEHYRRLEYANKFLGRETFRKGYQTDMGRFYILLGAPRSRQNFESRDEVYPAELWFYNNPELKNYGLPPFFYLLFFKRHGTGEFQLYDPIGDGPQALLTRVNTKSMDFRNDVEKAYNELYYVDPELAAASLSFRTDEGDVVQFQATPFGTVQLLDQIVRSPFYGLDTSYAERLDFERGAVESDYLFRFVPSAGMINILPGPEGAAYLHWVIELAPENIAFVRDRDSGDYSSRFITSVEIESKTNPGKLVVQERKESFVTLKPTEQASLHLPLSYSGMTPMVPGKYTVRVILRNRACPGRDEKDCIKSYTLLDGDVTVPRWSSNPLLGDLILAYETELQRGEPTYRSYVLGNLSVLPNPSGVYAIGDKVVAVATPWKPPAGASVRFRLVSTEAEPDGTGGTERAEAVERKVVADQTVPIQSDGPVVQEISLQGFDGGRFQLRATLLDSSGNELDDKLAALVVSPRTSIARPSMRGAMPQVRPELPGIVSMTLGEQYLALGQTDESRRLFEEALAANPKLGPAREDLASMALADGNAARVVDLLEPVYAQVKDRFEVLALLGQAYFLEKRYQESVDLLEKAVALRRPQPDILNVLANANYRVGNLARAQELLEQSLSLDPQQDGVKEILEKVKAERAGAPGS